MSSQSKKIADIVKQFRGEMAAQNSTFFLIYTDVDKGQIKTLVTTNSTPVGISGMLNLLLTPNDATVQELIASVRGTTGHELSTEQALDILCRLQRKWGIALEKPASAKIVI